MAKKDKNDLTREAEARWKEAREVASILHETWAATLRSKRNILESAMKAGIKPATANQIYQDTLNNSLQQYTWAFTRMCELSDEYTSLTLSMPAPKKEKR